MQFPPDEQELICRAFHVEGKAIRQIERKTDHSRQAIRRAISNESSARNPPPLLRFDLLPSLDRSKHMSKP